MAALSLSSLKAYVGGGAPRALHPSTVLLDVEHSLIQQRFVEIPFDVSWSVLQVQEKVHQLCGTQVEHMQLHLHGPQGPLLHPPQATLASFGVRGGGSSSGGARLLYVKDLDPFALGRGGGLHDVSQVQKYVMSDEQYRQRDNTYHSFKEKQKALDPAWRSIYEKKKTEGAAAQGVQVEEESLEEVRRRIALHSRCQITPGERRGTVRCQPQRTTAHAQHSRRSAASCHQPQAHPLLPCPPLPSCVCLCVCQTWGRCPSCGLPRPLLLPPLLCGLESSWTSRWASTQARRAATATSRAETSTAASCEPATYRQAPSLSETHSKTTTTTTTSRRWTRTRSRERRWETDTSTQASRSTLLHTQRVRKRAQGYMRRSSLAEKGVNRDECDAYR